MSNIVQKLFNINFLLRPNRFLDVDQRALRPFVHVGPEVHSEQVVSNLLAEVDLEAQAVSVGKVSFDAAGAYYFLSGQVCEILSKNYSA